MFVIFSVKSYNSPVMKIKIIIIGALLISFFLLLGSAYADQFPKIDVFGYKKWQYKEVSVTPRSNYFLGVTLLGGGSSNLTGGPWQESLQLKIVGQLNEKLSVAYDVEQQPETPDTYNVKVNYDDKHELTFGDFTTSFSGNEFASATKFLNGVMVTSKGKNYDFIAVPSAKLKSQIQPLTSQIGNNTTGPYSLGHGSIVENSEYVELNGIALARGKDYLINYFEGKITFTKILTTTDTFKYSYEYTNILDLFFPSLSKKDFLGLQGRVILDSSSSSKGDSEPQPVEKGTNEIFPTTSRNFTGHDSPLIDLSTSEALSGTEEVNENEISDEILEDESVGKYQLKNFPVVQFSEALFFKGRLLAKNEDYNIDYSKGSIVLILPELPDDSSRLEVSYSYYKTEKTTDNISGNGGRGPYSLLNQPIVPNSEKVYVNERFVIRDFDYYLDNETGKITFNYNVSNTSNIRTLYSYIVREVPTLSYPDKNPKSATIGFTYLKESAQKSTSSITATDVQTFRWSDIASNESTIYLSKFPILSTQEGGILTVSVGNQTLVYGIDYVIPTIEVAASGNALTIPSTKLAFINDPSDISNGYYTGTIKMLTSFNSTAEVSVTYTYYKNVIGRFTGTGDGSRGPYYLTGYRNVIPGSEHVDVWITGSQTKDNYVRNSSTTEANGNYSINYTSGSPSIMFNQPLDTTKSFDVYFQYVAQQSDVSSDISQDLIGFDADVKFGEILQMTTNYAQTNNDKVISSVSTTEAFSFSSTVNRVVLSFKPVIEGSDNVYINQKLVNRDGDYFIDYTSGTITFYSISLGTQDSVTVDYKYQSQGGIQEGITSKIDKAYKYGIKSKIGKISLAYNNKNIGFDFSPLGSTAIGVGSNYQDFAVQLEPLSSDFKADYSYRETNNPIGASRSAYTHNYERLYNTSFTPFGWAGIAFVNRNQEVRGDPVDINKPLSADSSLNSYSLSVAPKEYRMGLLRITHKYDGQKTFSKDRLNFSKGDTTYGHVSYGFGFTDRIKASTDFQLSEPKIINTQTSEVVTSWKTIRDLSYDISIDLPFPKIQKMTTYAKQLDHEEITHAPSAESKIKTKNTTYHIDLNPTTIINTSYDYNRQETPSLVVQGKNPKDEKLSTSIKIDPYSYLSTKWFYTEDHTVHETGVESRGNSNTYNATWIPISFNNFKLNSNYTWYGSKAITPSGTFEVATDNRSFIQDYTLTINPAPQISLVPGFVYEDYFNATSTATSELKTNNQTVKCSLTFTPIDKLVLDAEYNLKVTTNITDNQNRHKSWSKITSKYRAFSWGELVHTLEDEHNQGEVQAGGAFPETDYLKTINTWSFNFNVPQENPILSSVIFTASYKTVSFENKIKPSDNLNASSASFDFTLSF
ncbi:hypothetical protein A2282_01235 [candidate division WOR-1 bacterium RIFOXYA12_FULL_36_13]|nr:MAG: hypothetical protein A2282_01235 [candidate division WOR-1 bacterium RIFOXYA12_FULL_36_13]